MLRMKIKFMITPDHDVCTQGATKPADLQEHVLFRPARSGRHKKMTNQNVNVLL